MSRRLLLKAPRPPSDPPSQSSSQVAHFRGCWFDDGETGGTRIPTRGDWARLSGGWTKRIDQRIVDAYQGWPDTMYWMRMPFYRQMQTGESRRSSRTQRARSVIEGVPHHLPLPRSSPSRSFRPKEKGNRPAWTLRRCRTCRLASGWGRAGVGRGRQSSRAGGRRSRRPDLRARLQSDVRESGAQCCASFRCNQVPRPDDAVLLALPKAGLFD